MNGSEIHKSEALHKEALEHIVGGVNSPSPRSFKAVGGGALVAMERGKGAYFWGCRRK